MLQLKNISRVYQTDDVETRALNGVSINLRRSEFVSILGPSGSGKTTLLNIIGGLDHYTSGDILIDGVSTKEYDDRDWDTYRNRRVGFVFQNYNLIGHQTVLANVELALTLSGISGAKKKQLSIEALKKVGLGNHINKKPSQLSGGQMQRVAIARALVNDPDIVLADEPTGALDSKTSIQIMDLLKEIANDKLVVMVTHNPEIAKAYSTRIINVKDGKIVSDTKPYDGDKETVNEQKYKHTSLSLLTALNLSKNNLLTKYGRTMLTAVAGSIGIVGIALILGLATGVNKYVDTTLSSGSIPSAITVEHTYTDASAAEYNLGLDEKTSVASGTLLGVDDISSNNMIARQKTIRFNDTKALKSYLDSANTADYIDTITYDYDYEPEIYSTTASGEKVKVNPVEGAADDLSALFSSAPRADANVKEDDILRGSFKEIVNNRPFEVLEGALPEKSNELLLVLDQDSKINLSKLYTLDLLSRDQLRSALDEINSGKTASFKSETLDLKNVVGKTYEADFLNGTKEDLKIVGVAKVKDSGDTSQYLGYTHGLVEHGIKNSDGKYDIDAPESIAIYAKSNADKEKVKNLLDSYNKDREANIKYDDAAQSSIDLVKDVVNVLSYVLIAFVAISLIVSSIMIGIITYISVLERTKEIGILRAIGASKRDVVRVFRAETIIEGLIAGVLGIVFSELICLVVNFIISAFKLADGFSIQFTPIQALILILISVVLTVFAGSSPARRASKKDPVEALRGGE